MSPSNTAICSCDFSFEDFGPFKKQQLIVNLFYFDDNELKQTTEIRNITYHSDSMEFVDITKCKYSFISKYNINSNLMKMCFLKIL